MKTCAEHTSKSFQGNLTIAHTRTLPLHEKTFSSSRIHRLSLVPLAIIDIRLSDNKLKTTTSFADSSDKLTYKIETVYSQKTHGCRVPQKKEIQNIQHEISLSISEHVLRKYLIHTYLRWWEKSRTMGDCRLPIWVNCIYVNVISPISIILYWYLL